MRGGGSVFLITLLFSVACSDTDSPPVDANADHPSPILDAGLTDQLTPADGPPAARSAFRGEGLQENGSLAVFRPRARTAARIVALADVDASASDAPVAAPPGQGPGEWIEISAPILPDLKALAVAEGPAYPSSQAQRGWSGVALSTADRSDRIASVELQLVA
jgi:hypothetical protein